LDNNMVSILLIFNLLQGYMGYMLYKESKYYKKLYEFYGATRR